ncbi:MAG: hypothetical protein ACE5FQ_15690, partial [Thiogranum sp.]
MPGDIARYLQEAGRSPRLTDWQFRRMADAIRRLFPGNGNNMGDEVDWHVWLESSRSPPTDHRTIARGSSLPAGGSTETAEIPHASSSA